MGCQCTKESVRVNGSRYFVLERIADGGFGLIDLVEDKHGKLYALKRIKCESMEDANRVAMENSYYKRFDNSNIIKVVNDDIVSNSNNPGFYVFSVMPYYQNGTLQDELEKCKKHSKYLSDEVIVQFMLGVCNALADIHRDNFAHRDLKPQNILLTDNKQEAVLTDFGSMSQRNIEIKSNKNAQEVQEWAAENCSMFYKAPELFEPSAGMTITEKADVWSLGCNIYAAMYNKGPFDYVFEKGDSIALAVASQRYNIPHEPSRSDILKKIVINTIVSEPEKRMTLNQIIDALNELANNLEKQGTENC